MNQLRLVEWFLFLSLLVVKVPHARAASLLVSSTNTDQVLEYDGTTGAFISPFVAAGSGGLSNPLGLAFGPNGNLFVSSEISNQVLEYNGSTGVFVSTFVTPGSGGLIGPAFLTFTPVPEPATLNMVVLGAVAVLGYAWHRRKKAA